MLIHGTRFYHCIEQSSLNDCMTLFQMVIISQMNYLTVMLPEIVQNMSLIRGIFIAHSYLLKYMCYTGEILCMYIYSIYVFIYFGSFIFSEGLHHQDPALVPQRNPRKQKWSLLRVLVEKVMKRAWSRVLPFLHN